MRRKIRAVGGSRPLQRRIWKQLHARLNCQDCRVSTQGAIFGAYCPGTEMLRL
jgi:hypothetical protein